MTARFLTLADVSEILKLSMSATRSLVTTGELPAIQIGGKRQWRVEREELEKYIERQYQETQRRIERNELS